jgi:hypothetical protein
MLVWWLRVDGTTRLVLEFELLILKAQIMYILEGFHRSVVSRFQLPGTGDTNWCGAKHVSRAGSKRNKCKLLRNVMLNFFMYIIF